MNDLERLHEEARKYELKLGKAVACFLDQENVTMRSLKTFAYCTNEILAYIPDNKDYVTLVKDALYNVLLKVSIGEFVGILSEIIDERENRTRSADSAIFDQFFPE